MWEGVAEEAADAQRHIDARPAELGQRHDLEAGDALGLLVPRGAHAEQGEGLGDVVAVGAHRRRAPQHEAHRPGMGAGLGEVALDDAVGQRRADLPRQPGRDRLRVDGVEVAAGRQHVGGAAARRAARPGRDVASAEPGEQVGDLVTAAPQVGHEASGDPPQRRISRRRRVPAGGGEALDAVPARRLDAVDVDARRPSARSMPSSVAAVARSDGAPPWGRRVIASTSSTSAASAGAVPSTCRPPRIWASLSAHR